MKKQENLNNWFCSLFKSSPQFRNRDKFLARLFGIFSEEIVKIWCESKDALYANLGRPRIFIPPSKKGYTWDFTLKSRNNGKIYVAEMKCWVEYQNYKFLTLQSVDQLTEFSSPAFDVFLKAAKNPSRCKVKVEGETKPVAGAVLIWGDVSRAGRKSVKKRTGIAGVLSLKEMIDDLVTRGNTSYVDFLNKLNLWCNDFFKNLSFGRKR